MTPDTLTLNALDYRVYHHGHGDPLLMLHGFTGSANTWARLIPTLSRRFHTITPDLPGHGDTASPSEPERYSIDHTAADMIALLETLEVECVHLLGYSMGGRLALYIAARYPQRVTSLILESASPGLKVEQERAARRKSDQTLAARIEREGVESFVNYWESLPLWRTQQHTLTDEAKTALRAERLRHSAQGLANSLRGMGTGAQPSLWPELPALAMPVQLITGEWDSKFTAINREMAALLPRARFDVISRAGHAVHLENPPMFEQSVLKFLAHR
jgi:2-succinyl-6-hydroxy-2,4-cyclohexadiene-1-carboxylate synthase